MTKWQRLKNSIIYANSTDTKFIDKKNMCIFFVEKNANLGMKLLISILQYDDNLLIMSEDYILM